MPDIVHRVGIGAKPERVFEVLTSLEGNRGWWWEGATGGAQKGEAITFFGHDFKVTEADPGERVKWKCIKGSPEWLDTEITFQLVWKKDQTFVLFTHAKWKEQVEFMHHCSTRWATYLLSLKDLLEKGKGRPGSEAPEVYVGEKDEFVSKWKK